MRLVIQRVLRSQVELVKTHSVVGKIGRGLFILMGISENDSEKDADTVAEKLIKLRIMSDNVGKMNLSVADVKGEILVVSQFTLYADISGGNRPSFTKAARASLANKVYDRFILKLRNLGMKVETGVFGENMQINAVLDGPVTILV